MKLSLFVSFSGQGGVESATVKLVPLLQQICDVEVILLKARGPFIKALESLDVKIHKLEINSAFFCVNELARHIEKQRPDLIIAIKHRAFIAALKARKKTTVPVTIWGQIHTNNSTSMENKNVFQRALRFASIKKYYPQADRILCVSKGVAEDIRTLCNYPKDKLNVIYNPVVDLDSKLDNQTTTHKWLDEDNIPVIISAGRLSHQKGFDVLINAFALSQKSHRAKLLILGEGELRPQLQQQINNLGLASDVQLIGFTNDPARYFNKSRLFILSSRWEGFGLVLVEAMAAGCPVISTDCPSGPSDILQDGRYGGLVKPDDPKALANAIVANLDLERINPPKEAIAPYSFSVIKTQYKAILTET